MSKNGRRGYRPPSCVENGPGPILLLGPINTGKTTLFEKLVHGRSVQEVIPGNEKGIPLLRGVLHRCEKQRGWRALLSGERTTQAHVDSPCCSLVYDTPGTATLLPQNEDESLVRDALLFLRPRVLLIVADAKNVRRSLALTLHAAELGLPMVMAINMDDEATRRGIGVNTEHLAQTLGIDVIATTAPEGRGLDQLIDALEHPRVPRRIATHSELIEKALHRLSKCLESQSNFAVSDAPSNASSARGLALLWLGGDESVEKLYKEKLAAEEFEKCRQILAEVHHEARRPLGVIISDSLYENADALAAEAVHQRLEHRSGLDTLGELAEHRIWGVVIAALVVLSMYLWVGSLGATVVVDLLNTHIFQGILTPLSQRLATYFPSEFLRDALVDPEYGLLPTGLFLAFGIVLPVLFFFFFAFGVLRSSGYLARLSVLLDRIFRYVGLNGRGVMPIVMGFSCVTMALITTRMLESRRERIVASFLLLGLPCAPLLAVMMVILAKLPLAASLTVFGVLFVQKLLGGIVAARVLPGTSPDFIMVVPPLRFPRLRHVLFQSIQQTYTFMKEAVPLFLLASFLLFLFHRAGGLELLERFARPVTQGLLQLPDYAVQVFIKALVRRETGATELTLVRERFSNVQLVVTLFVMATMVPCVNSTIVLLKERGLKVTATIWSSVMAYAIVVGGAISHFCSFFGITFE